VRHRSGGDRIVLLVYFFPHQKEKISSLAKFSFIKRQGNTPDANEINQPLLLVKFRFGLLGPRTVSGETIADIQQVRSGEEGMRMQRTSKVRQSYCTTVRISIFVENHRVPLLKSHQGKMLMLIATNLGLLRGVVRRWVTHDRRMCREDFGARQNSRSNL
jgi:hypothetical protein